MTKHDQNESARRDASVGPPIDLAALRRLLANLPAADETARAGAAAREAELTKPAGALGVLEEIAQWLAGWQGRNPPRVRHPAVTVFAANHGVARQGVSAFPADVTAQMVANFEAGGAAINQLTRLAGARLAVVDVGVARPSADFTEGPAMTEGEFLEAFAAGMAALPSDCDLFAAGDMGIANTTAAAALAHGLFGGTAEDWTGPGAGVTGAALDNKAKVVATAVARHRAEADDPLALFARLGGKELAAIAGAVLAARLMRVPVILDGYIASAALAPLFAVNPAILDHCWAGHLSAEPAHAALLARFEKRPLLNLEMRLGEGSGAALAMLVVKAAAETHAGMATFAEAGVAGKSG